MSFTATWSDIYQGVSGHQRQVSLDGRFNRTSSYRDIEVAQWFRFVKQKKRKNHKNNIINKYSKVNNRLLKRWPGTELLEAAAFLLVVHSPFTGCAAGAGWYAFLWDPGGRSYQFRKSRQRLSTVFLTAPVTLCLDDNNTIIVDSTIGHVQQAPLDIIAQRRRSDVKAKVNGG